MSARGASVLDLEVGHVFRFIDETTRRVLLDVTSPSAAADPTAMLAAEGYVVLHTRAQHARAFGVRIMCPPTRLVVIFDS